MRRSHVGYILLLTLNIAFAQTYIVKFTSQRPDTARFSERFRSVAALNTPRAARTVSHSIRPLRSGSAPSTSAFPWGQYTLIRTSAALNDAALRQLSDDPAVAFIEPVRQYSVSSLPNDSAFSSQWNLVRTGIHYLYQEGTIVPSLPEVNVAFIDTGIDTEHPDLASAVAVNTGEYGSGKEANGIDDDSNGYIDDWRGYDFVQFESEDAGDWNERDNDPTDEHGHGTAVAGIIGARTDNGLGLAGITPARLIPLRAFGKNGTGNDVDIAAAVIYAAENGADVINMSFGDVIRSSMMHDALRFAYSRNIVLVTSSGNDGSAAPHYPSDFDEVISVGSVGKNDYRSFFSSYSPSLDLTAPGEQIVTTVMGGGYTDQFSGTSAAAPHVAAAAALVIASERKKSLTVPGYVRFTNEEIRGLLLQTADDIGAEGWDAQTGAGVLNAVGALRALAGSDVRIHSPQLDQIVSADSIPVVITSFGPYATNVDLSLGRGENPSQWTTLFASTNTFYTNDTVAYLNTASLTSGTYLLRLSIRNSKGSDQEFRQRIVVDRTQPRILSFRYRDSVIIGSRYGLLIEARVDRNMSGTVHIRKKGTVRYSEIRSQGVQMNHYFVITSDDIPALMDHEYYCEFKESGENGRTVRFPTISNAGTEHFPAKVSTRPIQNTGFERLPYTLPKSYLLGTVRTIGGAPTVIVNQYSADDDFGPLKAFQFSGAGFVLRDSTQRSWIPRALEIEHADGSISVLVQDHGVSRLFRADTAANRFFHQTVWGDSSDVWASAFTDLNGDGVNEIIARSSAEFLVYQKRTDGSYGVVSRLPNPSPPLSGEARNQFGPPRSISGDFSGSGSTEIIVADYDGDMLLYRQSAPGAVTFSLAAIDTSDLFGMSEYLASGDLNGDGRAEIIVAGHSNPDWNGDREYDAPVWTVRVFTHANGDPAGTLTLMWQQSFAGVKAGSGYDNGVATGRLRSTDTKDALFLSLNPSLYVFQWNASSSTFESVWHHPSLSNTVLVSDLNGDGRSDIGFRTNEATEFWSVSGASTAPTPFGVTAASVSAGSVRIDWISSAASHKVFRGTQKDSLTLLSSVGAVTSFIDTAVVTGVRYYYAVSAVGQGESAMSAVSTSVPHAAPIITEIRQANLEQLLLALSSPVAERDAAGTKFILDSAIPSSGVNWVSPQRLMVTFPVPVPAGSHTLKIRSLKDAEGMAADTSMTYPFSTTMTAPDLFLVRTVERLSSRILRVVFNQPVDGPSARNRAHFSVRTVVRSFPVLSVDSISPSSVHVNLSEDITRIATRIEVYIDGSVTDESGTPLNLGKGQLLSIAQETSSLKDIIVYPNPVRDRSAVTFINIPVNCRISIFAPTGEKLVTLSERTGTEGISWNLRTSGGNLVSTGIYLYRVEQMNETNEPIGTTMGKFAVIR